MAAECSCRVLALAEKHVFNNKNKRVEVGLSTSSIAHKVINHIALSGCDDVFGRPFFPDRWDEQLLSDPKWQDFLRSEISAALTQNPVTIGNVSYLSVPKGRHTFRSVCHLSLSDTLKYTALAFSIGKTIEAARQPKSVVFSNRFDGRSFTLNRKGYDLFRQKSKELSDSGKYKIKVITDISNFYDRLNLHKLENILKEIGCDEATVGKLNDVLMRWSHQQSYGLPVGTDASRLLAEAMLINADNELSKNRIKFVRYVDDYRIFCKSPEQAYEAMQVLDSALRAEGLFLNSGKTRLIDLDHENEEDSLETDHFEPIDLNEKIEKQTLVRSGRYSSRIAKYYKYPGKEAVKELQSIDVNQLLKEISQPSCQEDKLKLYIKASIYASQPNFVFIENALSLYPHLIPYACDALIKETGDDGIIKDDKYCKSAVRYFRNIYRKFLNNDYFRIQIIRLLSQIDSDVGSFISKEISNIKPSQDIQFSQTLYIAGQKLPRVAFLRMLSNYHSYGYVARTCLIYCLVKGNILKDEERKAQIRNFKRTEPDGFLNKLLKS
jgi:hypothetical protein